MRNDLSIIAFVSDNVHTTAGTELAYGNCGMKNLATQKQIPAIFSHVIAAALKTTESGMQHELS